MDFSKLNGLIPAVAQDDESGEVLMVGFMNEAALAETRRTGYMTFFSRSRQSLWVKGRRRATSSPCAASSPIATRTLSSCA